MDTDGLLTLTQWLSPAYPVGAFAYSHGLEGAVAAGWVRDAEVLEGWLRDVLDHGAGRNDALFLAAAYHADIAALAEIDTLARALAPSRERLLETDALGAAFGTITGALWGDGVQGLTFPVALGHAAAREGIALDLTTTLYLQAFASNLIAAGQRLLPLGQTKAQHILRALAPLFTTIAADTSGGDLAALSSTAFLADIASMRHETQYSRIFRT
ncbi:MAG: urease accessory UreF family protein [Paracoccaceae bacterium]